MKARKMWIAVLCGIIVLVSGCGSREEGEPDPGSSSLSPDSAGDTKSNAPPAAGQQKAAITISQAKEIAITHAGITDTDILDIHTKLEREDGLEEYEVEFSTRDKKYEYSISAADGTILTIDETSLGTDKEPSPKITEAEAKEIAFQDAGVAEEDIRNLKIHFDIDDYISGYEIEFEAGNKEYEYEISLDGTIRSRKVDIIDKPALTPVPTQPAQDTPTPVPTKAAQDTPTPVPTQPAQDTPTPVPTQPTQSTQTPAPTKAPQPSPTPASSQLITENEAKKIAFQDAGVTDAEVSKLKIKFDYDNGHAEYEVEFEAGNKEYDYEISAIDGTILEKDIETFQSLTPAATPSKEQYITENEAKQIAFTDAGITEAEARKLKIELDYDDGQAKYEIEFDAGYTEYSYDISATDGTILAKEAETDDDFLPATPGRQSITAEEAKQIAFSHAGVTESEVRNYEIETEHEDGFIIYEIEFDAGYTEYQYEISADGTILDWEIEIDDEDWHHSHHHSFHTGIVISSYFHGAEGYHC